MRGDGADIKQAKAIKHRNIFNTSSALERIQSSLVHILKVLVSHTGAFESEYEVNFVHTLMTDIVSNELSSQFL